MNAGHPDSPMAPTDPGETPVVDRGRLGRRRHIRRHIQYIVRCFRQEWRLPPRTPQPVLTRAMPNAAQEAMLLDTMQLFYGDALPAHDPPHWVGTPDIPVPQWRRQMPEQPLWYTGDDSADVDQYLQYITRLFQLEWQLPPHQRPAEPILGQA